MRKYLCDVVFNVLNKLKNYLIDKTIEKIVS